ncbi:MAG: hypothetical protein P4L46_12130 [Fimbriimonas sp.]|nr:hypothetical protein [Fimbriimonas sp.]
MKPRSRVVWGVFSAAALAGLTLIVFYSMQFYGPESVIWRLNEELRTTALNGSSISTGNSADLLADDFLAKIEILYRHGATLQIPHVERIGNEVDAIVLYRFPETSTVMPGTDIAMIWVVVRRGRLWQVDIDQTARIFRANTPRLPFSEWPRGGPP